MIDYSSWPRKRINVTSLRLDSENLRLSGFNKIPSTRDIIEYMVKYEKVDELAKSIVSKGYMIGEEPIIWKNKDKYIVLEGNRRVTACKLLIQPDLAPSNKVKYFENLSNKIPLELIKRIFCYISPTREAADIIIENRHTKTEIEKWDRIKQYKFYYIRFKSGTSIKDLSDQFDLPEGEVTKRIRRYEMFELSKNITNDPDVLKYLSDETQLGITTFERFYESNQGKDFLGIQTSQEVIPKSKLPSAEFSNRITAILKDLINKDLNSRVYGNNSEENNKYIDNLFDKYKNLNKDIKIGLQTDESVKDETPVTEKKEEAKLSPSKPKSKSQPAALLPKSWKYETNIQRINYILSELSTLPYNTKPNATLVLFRSFLEMVTYQYLEEKEQIMLIKKAFNEKNNIKISKSRKKVKSTLMDIAKVNPEILSDSFMNKLIPSSTVSKEWIPSLKMMLDHIAVSEEDLTKNNKMKAGLKEYLKSKESIVTHDAFNQLVHNEYMKPPSYKDLSNQLGPIKDLLEFMLEKIQRQ